MEKKFNKLNYYDMLDLKPNATLFDIRHAYNAALHMYQTDSLVSYSFFSAEERKAILDQLEKAYLTLINEKKRQDYDQELIRLGILHETALKPTAKAPVKIFDINRAQVKSGTIKNATVALRAQVRENKVIGELLSQQEISGSDLQKIRQELALPLEHIAQETKIRIDYLRGIENDDAQALPAAVFLKGFIKSYLKCLCLEPVDEICHRYMNRSSLYGGKS
jgi:DnaJ-class molecular chaperone